MEPDPIKVGAHIHRLRKRRQLTQVQLGELLHISFQAVSKWERGETLPDVSLLPRLAQVLETTIDNILMGGEREMEKKRLEEFTRMATIAQMREGVECLERMGQLLGKDSFFYLGAVGGVDLKMNTEFEKTMANPDLREIMFAEAAIQAIQNGAYIAPEDIQSGFKNAHWAEVVMEYAKKYGIC